MYTINDSILILKFESEKRSLFFFCQDKKKGPFTKIQVETDES